MQLRAISLFAVSAAFASAQTGPEIMKKVAETYGSLKTYQFESLVVNETVSESNESRSRNTRISAAKPPDRRRLESKGGQMASMRIFDGQSVWEYRPGPNQFARQDQKSYQPPRMNTLGDPVESYKSLEKFGANAKLLREETLNAGGADRACWVVEVPPHFPVSGIVIERSPTTYWVEKATHLIVKETATTKLKPPMQDTPQTQISTATYSVLRVAEPIPDDLFKFTPPPNASEVSEFNSPFGGGSTLAGRPAPAISLTDLASKEVTLESFRGKPVLINFWATWCAPCREQMPRIQEAHRAFADKGLVVLGINSGETPDVAKKYIEEKQYTFPVFLDRDKSVGNKLSVSSIPVLFLIDKEGTVRLHVVGYSSNFDLKEELKKIGL